MSGAPAFAFADDSESSKAAKPLEGKYISVMGDSISTYAGWSDSEPITDESCQYRYGEAYYGPAGGDYHNTDMLVTDTWWYQAADELGATILRSNAGNSTGLFYASYPANADWQQYLQDMLMYKTRPYHLGTDEHDPDIIALYVGSNEVAKAGVKDYGSIDEVDFDTLITENEDGTYSYATPATVAESYCILLHKVSVTYPDAEIYCFAVVPSAGGYLSTVNKRLQSACPFNEMVRGVADHYGAYVVDLMDEFQLDPDGDGVAVQEDFDRFQSYYHNDPHPNAAGFDVITRAFVKSVTENSKYMAKEESPEGPSAEESESMTYVNNEVVPTEGNDLLTDLDPVSVPSEVEVGEGYDFKYVGYDKHSAFFEAFGYTDPALGMADEQPVVIDGSLSVYVNHNHDQMADMGLAVNKAYLPDRTVAAPEGSPFVARWASVHQFVLADKDGNTVTTYCADQSTTAKTGYNYSVISLADSDHYDKATAGKIRAIAMNGYWGTQESFGSLESVKQLMRDSGNFSEEEIGRLTDGMALTATQLAIWTYANKAKDRSSFNVYYAAQENFYKSFSAASEEDASLIFGLYRLLVNLDSASIDVATTQNTTINESRFLDQASMRVTSVPENHPANLDEDDSNDVCIADFTFGLSVESNAQRDNLAIAVYEGDGADPVAVGRIAGDLQQGEQALVSNDDGTFTLSGLEVGKGIETFRIVMTGTQDMDKEAQLFFSEEKDGVCSQTMLGIAEGQRQVNVSATMEFNLEADDATDTPEQGGAEEGTQEGGNNVAQPGASANSGANAPEGVTGNVGGSAANGESQAGNATVGSLNKPAELDNADDAASEGDEPNENLENGTSAGFADGDDSNESELPVWPVAGAAAAGSTLLALLYVAARALMWL